MVIAPADAGAVAVTLKAAVPVAAFAASPEASVTVHVSVAPAADGKLPQSTDVTPVPALTAVATTPAGSTSFTVADVPDVVPPLLPRPSVYVSDAPVTAVAGAVLLSVRFDGVFTVVAALAQLVVLHDGPGVAGLVLPVGSTDA